MKTKKIIIELLDETGKSNSAGIEEVTYNTIAVKAEIIYKNFTNILQSETLEKYKTFIAVKIKENEIKGIKRVQYFNLHGKKYKIEKMDADIYTHTVQLVGGLI